MAEALRARRVPDAEAAVRQSARAWGLEQQVVSWGLVSTVPMRVVPDEAPRWQAEGEVVSLLLLRLYPSAWLGAPGV